ncbi:proteophosphoglycan ppg4 [Gigaspora margarita]|uniref:Proteophosphoglycan ppg4 n=1 Tax=Gigaspora margarita TaxID=4874 RepID=A0A8H4ALL2_GIGMA|nr:proteophosphoglycan ppg4 [Gigaspora margarita]
MRKKNMNSLFNGVLVKIIKEKPELKRSKLSIEEKTNIAISFYEKLEFRHRNREFAEQVFKKTNNNLLKDHDKKIKAYSNQISENNFQFLSHKTCEQYWNTLADEEQGYYQRQHRLNAEKRVMEVDTIIGQKWVNDLGKRVMESDTTIGQKWVDDLSRGFKRRRREASPLARYSGISNAESLVDDMESDDTESDDETISEGDGDEFIERFHTLFIINNAFIRICTTQIINISDHETANQHDELKKWVLENRVIDITDKEKDEIENYVINVFERNIEETIKSIQDKKINLDQKDAEFIKRILDAWAFRWKAEFNENMSESTYTATWIAPDFEILKSKNPELFTSSWCEMIHPSSRWIRQNVYKSNKKAGRKCDGILFIKNSLLERLVFENVSPPKMNKRPKYYSDLKKAIRNAVDSLCTRFWSNREGDVEIARKYMELVYIVHS